MNIGDGIMSIAFHEHSSGICWLLAVARPQNTKNIDGTKMKKKIQHAGLF